MVVHGHRPAGLQTSTAGQGRASRRPWAVTAGAANAASPVTCVTVGAAAPLRFQRVTRASNSATRAAALQLAGGDCRGLERPLDPRPPGKKLKVGRDRAQGRATRPPPGFPPLESPLPRVMIQTYLGNQVPAYAYARNNPVTNTDPTGLGPPGSAVPCTPTDSTYSCCIKQNPGNQQKCTGGEEPIKDIPNLAQAACQRQLTECIISCESACDPPTGRLGQTRAAICVSFCHIAYAVCAAKAPLPGAQ